MRREIKKKVREESVNCYLQNLAADEDTDYSLWKATKRITRPITHPIGKEDGTWARDNKQEAEVFADHLAETFKPSQIHTETRLQHTENMISEDIKPVSPKVVANEIRMNFNPKKAPRFDLITGEILKQLPKKGIVMLTYLYNAFSV